MIPESRGAIISEQRGGFIGIGTYGEQGPIGLLPTGKKVVALIASGGVYSSGPAQGMDFISPYIRNIFGFIGITDVEIVRAEAQANPNLGKDSLKLGVEAAEHLAN
ncbi:NAD(P)H-dependent oxidoreductase [Rhizobium sp. 2YAF20]|uniref:NAD(P)H-dependent oxidoreductase n=1 Tax=Rhizobium sp. 2YAF20 TaxID=3233027 RepID=UPI003F9981EF